MKGVMSSSTTNRLQWPRFDYEYVSATRITIMAAMDFAYTGRVKLTLAHAVRLLLFSVNISCSKLRDWCTQFLTSNGRISGENVSQIWVAANSILNEQLMKACVEVIMFQMERLDRDFYTWSHTSAQGMRLLLEADHNFTTKRGLEFWLHLEPSDDTPKNKLCSLIGNSNLQVPSFDALLFIYSKAIELRISQEYRNKIEEALKSGNIRNIPQAGPSTSQGTSITTTTTTTKKFKQQILAISSMNYKNDSALMKNVPELQNDPAIQHVLPFRKHCRFVIFRDYACTLGGCSADCKESYSTFNMYNLETSKPSRGPSMLRARGHFATVATSDLIFVFGGTCNMQIIPSCEYYKSNRERWVALPAMPKARINVSAVHVPGGFIVVGGSGNEQNRLRYLNDVHLLRFKSDGASEGKWSWLDLPPMLEGRNLPGITYHNGRVFVAGCIGSPHIEIESLKYPTMPNEDPQWMFISLLEISFQFPVSFIELNGRLLLINGDGHVLEYHEVAKYSMQFLDSRALSHLLRSRLSLTFDNLFLLRQVDQSTHLSYI
ncbi:hypothetical protein ACTXT7_016742 [Hymenolepis weldensis]